MRPKDSRWTVLVVLLSLSLASSAWGQDAAADQAKALLQQGVTQFKNLDFKQAKATLLKVQRDKLADAQRQELDSYLAKVDGSVKQQAAALEAYDNGLEALKANDLDKASALLDQAAQSDVLPEAVRKDARAQRALVMKKIEAAKAAAAAPAPALVAPAPAPTVAQAPVAKPVESAPATKPAPTKPAAPPAGPVAAKPATPGPSPMEQVRLQELGARIDKAKAFIVQGNQALDNGDQVEQAIGHFQKAVEIAPEYEPARERLQFARSMVGQTGGLASITQLEIRRRVQRQEAEVRFAEAMKRAREGMQAARGSEDFSRATEDANYALALVTTRKDLFTDAEYREKRAEVEKFLEFVSLGRERFEQTRAVTQAKEIEQQRLQRERETERQRVERVATLKSRVKVLRDEQKYAEAVEILDRIRKLDPADQWAAEWHDQLTRFMMLMEDKEAHKTHMREEVKSLVDIRWSAIPWYELLRYPRDWPEITIRRQGFSATVGTESEANRATRKKLQQVLPRLEFTGIAFQEVIQFVRDVSNCNIYVKWGVLQAVGIDKTNPVNIKLTDVTVDKALRTILEDVGGVHPLGFVLDEGVITVSTKDDLSKLTATNVYDIRDLIIRVPNFIGPRIDLSSQTSGQNGTGGTGGTSGGTSGGIFGTGGTGGGTGGTGGGTGGTGTSGGGQGDEENLVSRQELVTSILDLIRSTIAPESWRENSGTVGSLRELNGQIIVTQTAENHRSLLDLLSQLRETRALQINIEARFILVSTGFLNRIGVDLDFFLNTGSHLTPTGTADPLSGARIVNTAGTPIPQWDQRGSQWTNRVTPLPVVQNSHTFTQPQATMVPGSIGGQVTADALSVAGTFLDDIQVDFLVTATQAHQSTRTLTAPRITIYNGQRAYVILARQQAYVSSLVPVQSTVTVNGITSAITSYTPSVSTVATGTVLDVEGTISADRRYVNMTIRPQISTINGFEKYFTDVSSVDASGNPLTGQGYIQLPTVTTQAVQCTVSVPDGGTLLLGGQKLAGETEREMGVPILSKIPILERAFTNKSLVRDEETLLMLVKPKIIIQREYEEQAFPP